MTAQGSKISRARVLSWPPVCPPQGSPTAFTAAAAIRTLPATGHTPATSWDILQETAASPARSRSSRTTLH
jgi:hypothetical protein